MTGMDFGSLVDVIADDDERCGAAGPLHLRGIRLGLGDEMIRGEEPDEDVVLTVHVADGVDLVGLLDREDRGVGGEVTRHGRGDGVGGRGLVIGRCAGAAHDGERRSGAEQDEGAREGHGPVTCTPWTTRCVSALG